MLVSANDVRQGKPHPEPYLTSAARLGLTARQCLVIEDSPSGASSGRAAGATVLALLTTFPREALTADGFAQDLAGGVPFL